MEPGGGGAVVGQVGLVDKVDLVEGEEEVVSQVGEEVVPEGGVG